MDPARRPSADILFFRSANPARDALRLLPRRERGDWGPGSVSVLMAVYHTEKPWFLTECLQSLAAQTRPADEIVLVEDGPLTPALYAVIERFRTKLPIVTVVAPENRGLAAALNLGLPRCRGRLIARMDSDDVAHSERIEKQVALLRSRPDVDIVGSFACEIDGSGRLGRIWRRPVQHDKIMRTLWANPMIHPSVMVRREMLVALRGYAAELRRSEDHDLWFRAAGARARFHNIPEPLLLYRFSAATHGKQSWRTSLERARVASRGAKNLGMSPAIQLAARLPLIRAMLPPSMRHAVYRAMQLFDPRLR
jgi:glycosyltransferase involved in cell wall biosynthesis